MEKLFSFSLLSMYRSYDYFSMPTYFPPTLYKVSENACYFSVQNLLSSSLASKNLKVNMYRNLILPVVLYGCETWSLLLREDGSCSCLRIRH